MAVYSFTYLSHTPSMSRFGRPHLPIDLFFFHAVTFDYIQPFNIELRFSELYMTYISDVIFRGNVTTWTLQNCIFYGWKWISSSLSTKCDWGKRKGSNFFCRYTCIIPTKFRVSEHEIDRLMGLGSLNDVLDSNTPIDRCSYVFKPRLMWSGR